MKTFALTTAALGLAITATPTMAETATVKTIEISTTGLDLSTMEGQRMLDRRVQAAARNVCSMDNVSRTGTRIKSPAARECYRKALASAKQQVAAIVASEQRGG